MLILRRPLSNKKSSMPPATALKLGLSADALLGQYARLPLPLPAMAQPVFRLAAHFSGRVQGVGFRYNARQIAQGFEVTGCVRNLPDGRVHLIAEGAETEVHEFVREIQAQLIHHIKETSLEPQTGLAQFRDFHIG